MNGCYVPHILSRAHPGGRSHSCCLRRESLSGDGTGVERRAAVRVRRAHEAARLLTRSRIDVRLYLHVEGECGSFRRPKVNSSQSERRRTIASPYCAALRLVAARASERGEVELRAKSAPINLCHFCAKFRWKSYRRAEIRRRVEPLRRNLMVDIDGIGSPDFEQLRIHVAPRANTGRARLRDER